MNGHLVYSGAGGRERRQSRILAERGITGLDTTGLYVDELPIPSSMDPKAVDLDRIEVLRGLQGSLFGACSMGGTIRLISKPLSLEDSEGSARIRGECDAVTTHGGNRVQNDLPVSRGVD